MRGARMSGGAAGDRQRNTSARPDPLHSLARPPSHLGRLAHPDVGECVLPVRNANVHEHETVVLLECVGDEVPSRAQVLEVDAVTARREEDEREMTIRTLGVEVEGKRVGGGGGVGGGSGGIDVLVIAVGIFRGRRAGKGEPKGENVSTTAGNLACKGTLCAADFLPHMRNLFTLNCASRQTAIRVGQQIEPASGITVHSWQACLTCFICASEFKCMFPSGRMSSGARKGDEVATCSSRQWRVVTVALRSGRSSPRLTHRACGWTTASEIHLPMSRTT